MAERSRKTRRKRQPLKVNLTSRARVSIPDPAKATSYEERALVCLRLLAAGQWTTEKIESLKTTWGVTEAGINNYRRGGKVAIAAINSGKIGQILEETMAGFRLQADEAEEHAKRFEATGKYGLALRYREAQRRAEENYAEISGLRKQHMTISLEADPRIAGLWQAVWSALEDRDRQEEERTRRITELVERINGGVLPDGFADMLALPPVSDHLRDAVRRYEAEIGARKALAA